MNTVAPFAIFALIAILSWQVHMFGRRQARIGRRLLALELGFEPDVSSRFSPEKLVQQIRARYPDVRDSRAIGLLLADAGLPAKQLGEVLRVLASESSGAKPERE